MIFQCSFEELRALSEGARGFLADPPGGGAVAAPPAARSAVEHLLPRLTGDLSFATLAEQSAAEQAVRAVTEHLRHLMDDAVVETHAGSEPAVAAYFDYAHALSVLDRLEEMGREMLGLFELVHGAPPDPVGLHTFIFPD